MSEKSKSTPELLLDRQERTLRLVLRAIVRGNPDIMHRTDEHRVANALALLLGRESPRGAPGHWRDDMLEMMTLLYSIEEGAGRTISLQRLAESVIDMPGGPGKDPEGAVVKDLVRKFTGSREKLLSSHGVNGTDDFDAFYEPITTIIKVLRSVGIAVDDRTLPPGAWRGR